MKVGNYLFTTPSPICHEQKPRPRPMDRHIADSLWVGYCRISYYNLYMSDLVNPLTKSINLMIILVSEWRGAHSVHQLALFGGADQRLLWSQSKTPTCAPSCIYQLSNASQLRHITGMISVSFHDIYNVHT
jgi:hypothetical protein